MLATHLRFVPLSLKELSLGIVLKSGQSFRWKAADQFVTVASYEEDVVPRENRLFKKEEDATSSGALQREEDGIEYACGMKDRTLVIRQTSEGLYYRSLYPASSTATAPSPSSSTAPSAFLIDLESNTSLNFIRSYFQLDIPLQPLYERWSTDRFFAKKVREAEGRLDGIRILKQDPFEALISFICSSNNNIPRITLMVNALCKEFGAALPHPLLFDPTVPLVTLQSLALAKSESTSNISSNTAAKGCTRPVPAKALCNDLSFYAFPPPQSLTADTIDPVLRQLGFGYRAPFILESCLLLLEFSAAEGLGFEQYLEMLGKMEVEQAREALMRFMGVGPKVASCVALFGLGISSVIPVDTHVYQIAVRDYHFTLSSLSRSPSKSPLKPSTVSLSSSPASLAFPSLSPAKSAASKSPSKRKAAASPSKSITPVMHAAIQLRFQEIFGTYAGWAQQVLFFADLASTIKREEQVYSAKQEEGAGQDIKEPSVKATFEEEVEELIRTPKKRSRKPALGSAIKVEVQEEQVEWQEQHQEIPVAKKVKREDE